MPQAKQNRENIISKQLCFVSCGYIVGITLGSSVKSWDWIFQCQVDKITYDT